MSEILFHYHRVNPTTWVYLASLLMIGLFFKFGRFWSVRNLDLVLLILLAPGLLMAQYGREAGNKADQLARLEAQQTPDAEETASSDSPTEPSDDPAAKIDLIVHEPEAEPPFPEAEDPTTDPAEMPIEEPAPEEAESEQADELADEAADQEGVSTPAQQARAVERFGFIWLFAISSLLLLRLVLDPTMVRRPLLEPNLTSGGLTFSLCSLFVFLMANVITSDPAKLTSVEAATIEQIVPVDTAVEESVPALPPGPGYAILKYIPSIPTSPLVPEGVPRTRSQRTYVLAAKTIAILCHLAVVLGIVAIGYWHFGNTKTGVGVATLYLLLPYTAQMTGHIEHVIPAALLVWAILCYRRPLTAGMFIGLATSLMYYPLFLLPLWISFYWRRGLMRFVAGVAVTLLLMAVSLVFMPEASYWENLKNMFGLWPPLQEGLEGFWGLVLDPPYRVPVLAAFVALSGTLALWPAQKNLGTLLSCSAAVMVATQFWHGYGGGLYVAWYLPLLLLTVFRPNLEDRVALAVLGEGWGARRAIRAASEFKAA
ncbi:MAG: hypothetical protein H8E44_38845 [Planctomycetes bacterium]|nr:hypothetical protein [Planctomycetota bacterium]MBL7038887.1 hypothetical protein [Pirellulaceae bacterium]